MTKLAWIALAVAGCATTPSGGPVIVAERGPQPTPQEAERAILSALLPTLKDPDSLKQFRLREPVPITWYQGVLAGARHEEGWMVCFEYNAKNSFGAYVGAKVDRVAIRVVLVSGNTERYAVVVPANWPLVGASC